MVFRTIRPWSTATRKSSLRTKSTPTGSRRSLILEALEDRCVPATFTVLNTLDSGAGSLRQAILDANNNAGADTIAFNIPGAGVHTINSVNPGLPTITGPVTIDGYTQPGTSANTNGPGQADNAVLLIEIQHGVDLGSNGLVLGDQADGSTIRGLVINNGFGIGILIGARDVTVEGCFIGVDPTGTTAHGNNSGIFFEFNHDTANGLVGGTTPAARNLISGNNNGIFFQSGTNSVVRGNLIGTDVTGLVGIPNDKGVNIQGINNILIGGSTPAARNVINGGGTGVQVSGIGNQIQGNFIQVLIDGTTPGASANTGILLDSAASATQIGGLTSAPGTGPGNVIAAGNSGGIQIGVGSNHNVIQGNLIGLDATGTHALGIGLDGIEIAGDSNTIGGPSSDARNVISGCGLRGISLTTISTGSSHDNLIQNNFIGTDINGNLNSLGNGEGVFLNVSSNNHILNNVIVGNVGRGIDVSGAVVNTAILGNSIFANGGLGIDLRGGTEDAFGITANDPADPDSGFFSPNNLQNFPTITSVSSSAGSTSISGTLNSTPNTQFRLEFFTNDAADPSGFGEGQTFLGFTNVTTDASGDAAFNVSFANTGGSVITATATDPDGNTSEFSQVLLGPPDLQISVSDDVTSTTPGSNLTYTLNFSNISGQNSSGVQLTETLPTGTSFNPGASTSGWTETSLGSGIFRLNVGTLNAGTASSTALFVVTVNSPPASGQTAIVNTVSIADDGTHGIDPILTNNSASDTDTLNELTTDVSVSAVASSATIHAGEDVTFTITVRNNGANAANELTLTDQVPVGTTFISFTAPLGSTVQSPPVGGTGAVTATLASLAAGGVATFQLKVHVNAGTVAGSSITDTAGIVTSTTDTNPANNTATATTTVSQPSTTLTIKLVARYASFRNEFGLYLVDDASGRIGTLRPGDSGYARAALSRTQVVFTAADKVGTTRTLSLPAGSFFGTFLVQNSTRAKFLSVNPENRLRNGPLMFFSFRAANTDRFDHLRQLSSTRWGFEDTTNGGDKDFNDMIVDIVQSQTAMASIVQSLIQTQKKNSL